MILYHASKVANIEYLDPSMSADGNGLIYFSSKRENVMVYLVNAVEKCWIKHGNKPLNGYSKWAPYGFSKDGRFYFDEYYKNALEEVYKGECGYIYSVDVDEKSVNAFSKIPNAYTCDKTVKVNSVEYISDAYEEFLRSIECGDILLSKYDENNVKAIEWIKKQIINEYNNKGIKDDYKLFLESTFDFL